MAGKDTLSSGARLKQATESLVNQGIPGGNIMSLVDKLLQLDANKVAQKLTKELEIERLSKSIRRESNIYVKRLMEKLMQIFNEAG